LGLLGLSDVPGIAWDTFTGIFDPRNAWKNTQRAAGGVVGAGKFVSETVAGAGLLVIDVATMSVNDAAADRMVARGQGVWTAVTHPLDTVVNAHSDAFDKILEHEQKGEYFSSGAAAGELGVADAAAITGAYGAVRGVMGAVSRAASFGGLTEAAGAGLTEGAAAAVEDLAPRFSIPRTKMGRGGLLDLRPSNGGTGPLRWQRAATQPAGPVVHGNAAASPKTAYLYRLEDLLSGEHLKWGITDRVSGIGRYTRASLRGKRFIVEDQGPRSLLLQIERDLVELDPGPLNREPWAGVRR
jgi:hypothetical protein